ncbi:MAG: hypothetical protein ACKPCP_23465, partial [Sphaerospermopsis kisseleviana]
MTGDSRWGDGEMEKSGGTGEVNNLINYQLSTINYQLSTINYQLSIINYHVPFWLHSPRFCWCCCYCGFTLVALSST